MNFFDAHCHVQLEHFDADRAEVLGRMRAQGVGGVVVGTDLRTSREAAALAEKHDFLWAAVGLHPLDNPDEVFDREAFTALAKREKVKAVGECGLDYFRAEPDEKERARQKALFEQQLAFAEEVEKPLMIHCRPTQNTMNAHREMLELLKQHPGVKAIIHFFTGNQEIAEQYLALGCYLSFSGVITFADYDEVIAGAPFEKILTETDSPFAAPAPHRGGRNEPAYVVEVVGKIAAVKGVVLDVAVRHVRQNAARAFGIETA